MNLTGLRLDRPNGDDATYWSKGWRNFHFTISHPEDEPWWQAMNHQKLQTYCQQKECL